MSYRKPKLGSRMEQLETREMLAGHGFGGFGFAHNVVASFAAQQARSQATAFTSSAQLATAAHAGISLSAASSGTALTAQLSDAETGATGTATFKTYTSNGETETEFSVSVAGATADSTLDVALGGVIVGQLTTDSTGAGKLVLSSDPSGTEVALPADFPTDIAAGAAVSVGSLSGTLAASTTTGHGCGSHQNATMTRFSAALADPAGTATGTATYKTGTADGVAFTKFKVSVTGATAASTLDVAIDGTVIGSLTTDDTGAGSVTFSSNPKSTELALPANFPTSVAAGSTVTVGSLTGTLAASSSSSLTGSAFRFARHR